MVSHQWQIPAPRPAPSFPPALHACKMVVVGGEFARAGGRGAWRSTRPTLAAPLSADPLAPVPEVQGDGAPGQRGRQEPLQGHLPVPGGERHPLPAVPGGQGPEALGFSGQGCDPEGPGVPGLWGSQGAGSSRDLRSWALGCSGGLGFPGCRGSWDAGGLAAALGTPLPCPRWGGGRPVPLPSHGSHEALPPPWSN